MLEKTGATVTLANNGAEAVQMVAAGSFDLVLMDLQMPVMDGFEATRKILEEYPEVPVIALSAAVMEADQRQAREAGMKAHLAKPIDSAELYRTLSKWLQVQQGSQILQTGASADDSGLPEYMEGFDLDQGLKSTDGDAAFYLKMLHRFKEQLEGEFAFIDDKLQQAENEEGPRLVHTLKGIAGTVGAVRLAGIAKSMDQAFKEGGEITQEMRQELIQAMQAAQDQLATLPPLPGQTREVDMEQGAAAMSDMLQLLYKSEMIEEELLSTVAGFLRSRVGGEKPEELIQLVENFEHDAAASMLLEMASQIGVEIE
ncbi:MAG: response regulator, partial [Desulfohalobiaceae bacterium]